METVSPIVQARWRRSQIAETFASVRVSAPSYRFAENIGFVPIVEPELKLVQIQRQIFLADVMVCSDHAAIRLDSANDQGEADARLPAAGDGPNSKMPSSLPFAQVRVSFS
jgi:hypothetical protein